MKPDDSKKNVLDLVLAETVKKPSLQTVMHVAAWIDKQNLACREALAWLLIEADLGRPLNELVLYADELDRSPDEIAQDVDQLNLLISNRSWQRPSEVLDGVDRARVAGLAQLGSRQLRYRPKDLRLAYVVGCLQTCLSRGKL